MRTIIPFLFSLLIQFILNAQTEARHTVYFETDKDVLTEEEQKKLDKFITGIATERIMSIALSGHTDSDADNEYNLALSQRRVDNVTKHFVQRAGITSDISSNYFGEDQPVEANTSASGKQNNRRVDIVVSFKPTLLIPPKLEEKITEKEITGDTILRYPKGTLVILPKIDVINNPTCLSLVEFTSGEDVRSSDLTTMSSDGMPLISAGMFDIKMCDESKCVTVLVPVRTVCGQTLPFSQWDAQPNGSWQETTGRPMPIREIAGQNYYEMKKCGSGKINCDVRIGRQGKRKRIPKTRIRLKNGYQLGQVHISSDEPLTRGMPLRKTKRKAVFYRFCPCSDIFLYVEAKNKQGETKIIDFTPLNDFDKREAFGKCKSNEVVKKILFFKIREKTMYRKYIVRKSDFGEN